MKKASLVLLTILSLNLFSQNYYESSYQNLKDSIYYPKIDNYLNHNNIDSVFMLADEVYDFYYQKNELDRALYLFNLCTHFSESYGLADKTIPIIKKRITFLQTHTDTLNTHYGTSLYILAVAYIHKSELFKARPVFANAISVLEKSENTELLHMASAYGAAAFLNTYLNNNKQGYKLATLSLNTFLSTDTSGFSEKKKIAINNEIASSYLTFAALMKQNGQTELSLAYNKKALKIFSQLDVGKENMATAAVNISDNYIDLKQYEHALEYANYSDSIITTNNFKKKLKTTYMPILKNKGEALMFLNRYSEADTQFRLLVQFMKKEFPPEAPVQAFIFMNIANNFKMQNKLDSALFYYNIVAETMPNNNFLLVALAEVSAKKEDYKQAISYSKRNNLNYFKNKSENIDSIPLADQFSNNLEAYKSTYLTAKYYLDEYKEDNDIETLEQVINYSLLSDSLLSRARNATLIGADDKLLAKNYHKLAEVGMYANYKAYNILHDDKYLNNFFKFMMQSTAFKINTEVSQLGLVDSENPTEQIILLQKIRKLENEQIALKDKSDTKYQKEISDKLFDLKLKAFELSFKINNTEDNIANKAFYSETSYKNVQKELNNQEALLSYFMTDDEIYSIFISDKKIEINVINIESEFTESLKQYYKSLKTASPNLNEYAEKMYSYLITPFDKELSNIKKLTIIPTGKLSQIPFESLVYKDKGKSKYLIEKLAVSYNYSIFLWLNSRKLSNNNEQLSFVGFAPVFSKNNNLADGLNPICYDEGLRSAYSDIKDGDKLKALPYSEAEVIEIKKIFDNKGKKANVFTNAAASEKNLKENIKSYSIIHIATHGYSTRKYPKLSGLFMYNDGVKNEDVTNDGFVYIGEIFTMKPKADLVVLSACKTGTGVIVEGEGVIALPRAFLFAGVPNLVVSLWKIHDKETKQLMLSFYTNLLNGMSYSEALQQAKIKQIKEGKLALDWSALILIGK